MGDLKTIGLLFLALSAGVGAAAEKYPLSASLGGPVSPYTASLRELAEHWSASRFERSATAQDRDPVEVTCLETPGHRFYIGASQTMRIRAPLARVEAVVDDIDHYKDIFPGYEDIHVVSRDANLLQTYWEQKVPIPLVPNVKYEMTYVTSKPDPSRVVYLYQLKRSKDLISSDGLIVLEADGAFTRYFEYDFWDAHWGLAQTFAPGRIWRDSIEGLYLSDAGIKFRSEKPELTGRQVRDEATKLLEKFPVDECLKHKKRSALFRG